MTKQDIQPMLDELVEARQRDNMVDTFWGVNIEEMTREELLAVIHDMIVEQQQKIRFMDCTHEYRRNKATG